MAQPRVQLSGDLPDGHPGPQNHWQLFAHLVLGQDLHIPPSSIIYYDPSITQDDYRITLQLEYFIISTLLN